MKKGCIIALIVCFVLLLIVVIAGVILGPKAMNFGNSTMLFGIEQAGNNYMAKNPEAAVPTTNAEWVNVLQDTDYDKDDSGTATMEIDSLIVDGKFMDATRSTEVSLSVEDGKLKAVLPGKDGQVGTADDITSKMIRDMMPK